jgi:hypothetical protein
MQMQTEVQFMKEPGEKQPGLEGTITLAALFTVSAFVIRK